MTIDVHYADPKQMRAFDRVCHGMASSVMEVIPRSRRMSDSRTSLAMRWVPTPEGRRVSRASIIALPRAPGITM